MHTQADILAGLQERFATVADWFAGREDAKFSAGPSDRWTEGQHLDHLILSAKPLNTALRLPKVALKMQFGTSTSDSETLDGIVERYEKLLAEGGRASGRFVPPDIPLEDKPKLVAELRKQGQRLVAVAGDWSDADLDKYVLPHPLLGNLSVRDMLLFTVHHLDHHLSTLKRDY